MTKRPHDIFRDRPHGRGDASSSPIWTPAPVAPMAKKPASRYVVLVPYRDFIDRPVERQLKGLEDAGVEVARIANASAIDFCRSQLLTLAIQEGKEAVLFIDSDVIFRVDDALAMLQRPEPIVCGLYPQKKFGKLNVNLMDNSTPIRMGVGGGDRLCRHVGAGFLRVTFEACRRIVEHHGLPVCTAGPQQAPVIPFFLPMLQQIDGEWRYLPEDFAFCERALQAGLDVIADTRVRLFHHGSWPYGWEEAAGRPYDRVESVDIQL